MSSDILFIIRNKNLIQHFQMNQVGLARLYNPAIYQGIDEALMSFIALTAYPDTPLTEGKPSYSLFKQCQNVVIMDFDNKEQYDFQSFRNIRTISSTRDQSWAYIHAWKDLGWLSDGLVDPKTGKTIVPFNQESPISVLNNFMKIKRHQEHIYSLNILIQDHKDKSHHHSHLRLVPNDPKIFICPAEWKFHTYYPEKYNDQKMLSVALTFVEWFQKDLLSLKN